MSRLKTLPSTDQLTFVFELEPRDGPIAAEMDGPGARTDRTDRAAGERPDAEAPQVDRAPEPRSERDWRAILDFERGWSGPLPAKQRAIRASFGFSSARYHQLLDRALELPDALAYDAALVGRLRRVREARRSKRFAQRIDAGPRAVTGEGGSRGG